MKPRGRKKKISWRGDCPFSEIEETTVFTEMKDIPDSVYPISIDTGRDHLLVLDDEHQVWVVGYGKNGQLGLGPDVMHCDRLTKLPPLSTFLPIRAKARMILSRSAPSLSEAIQAVPKSTKEEFVVSVHCGPLTSALVTNRGRVLLWGYTYAKSSFTPEILPLWDSFKVRTLKMGAQHILALVDITTKGVKSKIILSWGKSSHGALGLGKGERVSFQPQQIRFFDNLHPIQIYAGYSSSGALLENGDIYLWGKFGNFCTWIPQKVNIPCNGILHSLYMNDENCIIHKGSQLCCINRTVDELDFTIVDTFDSLKYGVITQITCEGRNFTFLNHRGQVYLSRGDQFQDDSTFEQIFGLGYVNSVSCGFGCVYIISDIPLLSQSVELLTYLQSGNYSVPRIILDIHLYFNAQTDENLHSYEFSFDNEDSEMMELYNAYVELSVPDLSVHSPIIIFQLLVHYLKELQDPLIPLELIPSLIHKYKYANPVYHRIIYIKDTLEDESLKAAKGVIQHILQIFDRCLFWNDKSISYECPILQNIMHHCLFGNIEKDPILKEITNIILKFAGFWYTGDAGAIPMQLYLIEMQDSRLELLDMFLDEQELIEEKKALSKIIMRTAIIKKIISNILEDSLRTQTQIQYLTNILSLCIDNEVLELFLNFIKQPLKIENKYERETIAAIFHLACNSTEKNHSTLIFPIIQELLPQ